MKSLGLVALAATTLLNSSQSRRLHNPELTVDDALVLRAVLEHTILPEVRRTSAGVTHTPVALVAGRSIPLCRDNPQPDRPCPIPNQWKQFLVPNPAINWPGLADRHEWPGLFDNEYRRKELLDNKQRRKELIESLEARNAAPHALPAIDHPAIVLIPPDGREATAQYRGQTVGSSSLSLPGYSTDGHALVYGSYGCGNLCSYSWLFVLEKIGGQWRVRSSMVTAIS